MLKFVEKKFQNLTVEVNEAGSIYITLGTQVINLEFTSDTLLVETWDPENLKISMNKTLQITDQLTAKIWDYKPEAF
jgi:hypothetical protein